MKNANDLAFLRTIQRNCWHPGDPGRPPGAKDKGRRKNPRYKWSRAEIVDKFVKRFEYPCSVHEPGCGCCWNWTGATTRGFGYMVVGSRQDNGGSPKRMQAHRLSWILYKGCIPSKILVGQECKNKLCVNPAHLYLHGRRQYDG